MFVYLLGTIQSECVIVIVHNAIHVIEKAKVFFLNYMDSLFVVVFFSLQFLASELGARLMAVITTTERDVPTPYPMPVFILPPHVFVRLTVFPALRAAFPALTNTILLYIIYYINK